MANITSYLSPNPDVIVRDYQHAARVFVDDSFRLAPKQKFLFHVAFGINSAALKTIDLAQRHRNEINMLVKTIELPKFTMSTETVNQYNRKKVVQTSHKFEPISIKFHDDNMGLINQLWQNYYSYYYADSTSAKDNSAYSRNSTKSSDFITKSYGLDNKSTSPFFTYIKVYQMARHEWVSYTLKNPLITSWLHGNGSYADGSANEKTMSISYEAVSYDSGVVEAGNPEGFAVEHYDQTPSPLISRGTLDTASPSFANNLNVIGNASEFISNLTKQINTYQNTQQLKNTAQSGLISNIKSTSQQGVTGLQGITFPVNTTGNNNTVVATQINLQINVGQ